MLQVDEEPDVQCDCVPDLLSKEEQETRPAFPSKCLPEVGVIRDARYNLFLDASINLEEYVNLHVLCGFLCRQREASILLSWYDAFKVAHDVQTYRDVAVLLNFVRMKGVIHQRDVEQLKKLSELIVHNVDAWLSFTQLLYMASKLNCKKDQMFYTKDHPKYGVNPAVAEYPWSVQSHGYLTKNETTDEEDPAWTFRCAYCMEKHETDWPQYQAFTCKSRKCNVMSEVIRRIVQAVDEHDVFWVNRREIWSWVKPQILTSCENLVEQISTCIAPSVSNAANQHAGACESINNLVTGLEKTLTPGLIDELMFVMSSLYLLYKGDVKTKMVVMMQVASHLGVVSTVADGMAKLVEQFGKGNMNVREGYFDEGAIFPFTAIFLLLNRVLPGQRDLNVATRQLAGFGAGLKGMDAIVKYAIQCVNVVGSLVKKSLGLVEDMTEERIALLDEVDACARDWDKLVQDPSTARTTVGCLLVRVYALLRQEFADKAERDQFLEARRKLENMKKECGTPCPDGELRPTPYVVMITSPSRSGKSNGLNLLCFKFLKKYEKVVGKVTWQNLSQHVYTRSAGSEFWDGFKGQRIIIFDDFGSAVDSQSARNVEFLELLKAANVQPWCPPQADVVNKGKYYADPLLIILTSNREDYCVPSMTNANAMWNRVIEKSLWMPKKEVSMHDGTDHFKCRVDWSKVVERHKIGIRQVVRADGDMGTSRTRECGCTHEGAVCLNYLDCTYSINGEKVTKKPITMMEYFDGLAERIVKHYDTQTSINEAMSNLCMDENERQMWSIFRSTPNHVCPLNVSTKRKLMYLLHWLDYADPDGCTQILTDDTDDDDLDLSMEHPVLKQWVNALQQHRAKCAEDKYATACCYALLKEKFDQATHVVKSEVLDIMAERGFGMNGDVIRQVSVRRAMFECGLSKWSRWIKEHPIRAFFYGGGSALVLSVAIATAWSRYHGSTAVGDVEDDEGELESNVYGSRKRSKVRTTTLRESGAREMSNDIASDEIATALTMNACELSMLQGKTKVGSVKGIGLCDKKVLTVGHIMDLQWTSMECKRLTTKETFTCSREEIERNLKRAPLRNDGSRADLLLLEFHCASFRDMRSHFITNEDFDLCADHPGALAIGNANQTVSLHYFDRIEGADAFHVDDDSKYKTYRCISYKAPTSKGSCGSPVLVRNPESGRKIVGIHVGSRVHSEKAFGEIITRERLQELGVEFKDECKRQSASVCVNVEDVTENCSILSVDLFYDTLPVLKCDAPLCHMPTTSKIQPSAVHEELGPAKTRPALLRPEGDVNPIQVAVKKLKNRAIEVDEEIFYDAVESTAEKLGGPGNIPDMTLEEAVFGLPGQVNSVNVSSSPGVQWNAKKRKGARGKKTWIDLEAKKIDPELRKAVEELEEAYEKGERPLLLFQDCLKDERRPHAKVDEGKTRLFSTCPMQLNLLIQRKYGFVFQKIKDQRLHNGIAIGINPYTEWEKLYELLKAKGVKGFQGDFSGWDGSLTAQMIEGIFDVLNILKFGKREGDMVCKMIQRELSNSIHVLSNRVVEWDHSLASGICGTAHMNSIAQLIGWAYVCYKADIDINKMEIETFGDDNIVGCDASITQEHLDAMTTNFKDLGLDLTDGKKSGRIRLTPVDDLEFLKRSFSKVNGRVLGALDKDVIREMTLYVRGSDVAYNTRENIKTSLREAVCHGKKFHAEWRDEILEAGRSAMTYVECEEMDFGATFVRLFNEDFGIGEFS